MTLELTKLSTEAQAALGALTALVTDATSLRQRAENLRARARRNTLDDIVRYTDAARTRLAEDGDNYLDAALSIIDTCRNRLASHHIAVEREELRRG